MIDCLVSIIIPTYNRADTIVETIKSALSQTYTYIEVIVVDDASKDNTPEVVLALKDSRLRYIRNSENKGANVSRNIGIELASGRYIAFLDSADIWHINKIEMQLQYLKDEEDIDIVFCAEKVENKGKKYEVPNQYQKELIREGYIDKVLAMGNCIDTSTIFCRKECIDRVGMFAPEMPRLQDYEWVLRVVSEAKIGYLDECLVETQIREDSITADISKLFHAVPMIYNRHHVFFEAHKRNIDFLFMPIHEVSKSFGGNAILYEEYFSILYDLLSFSLQFHIVEVYKRIVKQLAVENMKLKYRNQNFRYRCTFECLIENKTNFNIFGAGEIAKKTYTYLEENGLAGLVQNTVVTSKKDNCVLDESSVLLEIDECDTLIKQMPIVLAVSDLKLPAVSAVLDQQGFSKIVILPI